MLSYLSSGSNGFLSEKQVYDYLNSRRVQGTPDLNPQLVAQMWRKYAALNQDRQDPDILKVLFLCNILADYARILLGNDEEDAAEILLPLLQKLHMKKEDVEMVLAVTTGHRDLRMLPDIADGSLSEITDRLRTREMPEQAREQLPPLTTEPALFARLKEDFQAPDVAARLQAMNCTGELAASMSYLQPLSREKYNGSSILDHCILSNVFMDQFDRRDYASFERLRAGKEVIEENGEFSQFCNALQHTKEYMKKTGIADPMALIKMITFFHDVGDMYDYGDHTLRGSLLVPAVFKAFGIHDQRQQKWASFIIRYDAEFGGIGLGERVGKTIRDALQQFDDPEERQMLQELLMVLTAADILAYRDGSLFTESKARFLAGLMQLSSLDAFDANFFDYRLKFSAAVKTV